MKASCLSACAFRSIACVGVAVFAGATAVTPHDTPAMAYGPDDCLSISRSSKGSCVLATECGEDEDLSQFEFRFDCTTAEGDVVRHSYGFGGFDAVEVFETNVQCQRCSPPAPASWFSADAPQVGLHHPKPPAPPPPTNAATALATALALMDNDTAAIGDGNDNATVQADAAPGASPAPAAAAGATEGATPAAAGTTTAAGAAPSPQALPAPAPSSAPAPAPMMAPATLAATEETFYGPDYCVSTHRSDQGSCIMRTRCNGVDISDYKFGLICVDTDGDPVRHMFGEDSFDAEETFDTLITCDQCVGLKAPSSDGSKDRQLIKEAVHELEATVGTLTADVHELKAAVFVQGEKTAGAASAAPAITLSPASMASPAQGSMQFVHHPAHKAAPARKAQVHSGRRKQLRGLVRHRAHSRLHHRHQQARYEDEESDDADDHFRPMRHLSAEEAHRESEARTRRQDEEGDAEKAGAPDAADASDIGRRDDGADDLAEAEGKLEQNTVAQIAVERGAEGEAARDDEGTDDEASSGDATYGSFDDNGDDPSMGPEQPDSEETEPR